MAIAKYGFPDDVDEAVARQQAEAQFRDTYPDAGDLDVSITRTPDHEAASQYLVRVEAPTPDEWVPPAPAAPLGGPPWPPGFQIGTWRA